MHAFVAGWTYWVNNLVYFLSLLLFIAGTFLFVGGDAWLGLGESGWYNAAFSLTLLWVIIGANVVGLSLVPGGTAGLWCVSFLGFSATMLSVALALVPPAGTENPKLFLIKVSGGCALFIVAGLLFYFRGHKRTA